MPMVMDLTENGKRYVSLNWNDKQRICFAVYIDILSMAIKKLFHFVSKMKKVKHPPVIHFYKSYTLIIIKNYMVYDSSNDMHFF